MITNSSVELRKGVDGEFLKRWLGARSLLMSDGQTWLQKRRLLTPGFHFQRLDDYMHAIDQHTMVGFSKMDTFFAYEFPTSC